MTQERITQFCEAAFPDEDTAKKLLEMTPEDVSAHLADQGCDFTAEEVREVGKMLKNTAETQKKGELDAEDLDAVAGGSFWKAALRPIFLGPIIAGPLRPLWW